MKSQVYHGPLEVGFMLISFGVKAILTQEFSFLYVAGTGQQALGAGLMAILFGVVFCITFIKNACDEIRSSLKVTIIVPLSFLLVLSSYLLPIHFSYELFDMIFFIVPVLSGGIGFFYVGHLVKSSGSSFKQKE